MAGRILIDSGPCVALFNRNDQHHERALHFIRHVTAELVSTLAMITEVTYLLDFSLQTQVDFLTWVRDGGITLVEPDANDLSRVVALMQKYADRPMDFADGLLVAVAERLDVKHIASIDHDFTIYRFKGRGRFVNVFWNQSSVGGGSNA